MRFLQPDLHPQFRTSHGFPSNGYTSLMDRRSTPWLRNGAHEITHPDLLRHPLSTANANHTSSLRIIWQGAAL